MPYNLNGNTIDSDANGFLVNSGDWSEELAAVIAAEDGLTLSDKHWDIIKYLRDEYFNNNASQPNTRSIVKAMSSQWGEKIDSKSLYELFPHDPSKQGGKIAGLPESRRKGGY